MDRPQSYLDLRLCLYSEPICAEICRLSMLVLVISRSKSLPLSLCVTYPRYENNIYFSEIFCPEDSNPTYTMLQVYPRPNYFPMTIIKRATA